ncbi:response regulator [Thioalkalivibrio sp.]|uniref:response regulator n=1 Tax=Thioalkalivibrio sp. TaxID=2093813 RepID=UPI00356A5C49
MNILILEDDKLVADLLTTLVEGLYAGASVFHAHSIGEALQYWKERPYDLVLAELSLPDGDGLEFLRRAAIHGRDTPVVIVAETPDRQSVRQAARYGVHGFISKPFRAELVQQRLQKILQEARTAGSSGGAPANPTPPPGLEAALQEAEVGRLALPTTVDLDALRDLRAREDTLSLSELETAWQGIPTLVARLIDASNTSTLRHTGTPNASLREALNVLGIPAALNLATAAALDLTTSVRDPVLRPFIDQYQGQSESIAQQAAVLAHQLKADPQLCYTAGLMHRLGELAVLATAQRCATRGCELAAAEIEATLNGPWPARMAGALKTHLRLSLALKQMVGAIYGFGLGSGHVHLPIMRAAFLLTSGEAKSEECRKLLHRLGIPESETLPARDAP